MQPGTPALLPGGFDPNDPKLNLLAQRMKSHLRKPLVNTDLSGVTDPTKATFVPVLDKGKPNPSGPPGWRDYDGYSDAYVNALAVFADRLFSADVTRADPTQTANPYGPQGVPGGAPPMQQITDHPRRDVLTSRKRTIDQKTNSSLAEFPDTLRFKDRMGREIDRGRDELERRRRDDAARERQAEAEVAAEAARAEAEVAERARIDRRQRALARVQGRHVGARRTDQRRSTRQDGRGLFQDASSAINRIVDILGEQAGYDPGMARQYAYYALIQMINAAQQQGISYDEYYSLRGDELRATLKGSGVDWKRVADIAGDIGNAAAVAGVGTAATGIGAAATPFLETAAGAAKGVEFVASMLGSGTDLDDALRGLYSAAQHIARREKMNPAQVAEAVRNLRGAPMVRANRGLVANTDLADSNYVSALEHTLQAQRTLPRRRSGAPETLSAQPQTSRRGVRYYRGTKHAR